jgi:hypothetical protein
MLGRFGVWQNLRHLASGDWNKVFRSPQSTNVEDAVVVHHPSRKQIASLFSPDFRLLRWRGIGIAVPPAPLEHWAVRFRRLTHILNRIDGLIGGFPGFRNLGECVLLEFERASLANETTRK